MHLKSVTNRPVTNLTESAGDGLPETTTTKLHAHLGSGCVFPADPKNQGWQELEFRNGQFQATKAAREATPDFTVFAEGTCGPHADWSLDHAEAFLEQGIPKCLDQRWDDPEAVMGYCQAFLHPAKKATPTNDLGAPCVVEHEYAEDNNEIVCTLKVVDSEGTLLAEDAEDNNEIVCTLKGVNSEGTLFAVVCPPCSHRNAPQVMSYRAA
jgi:hypothetical protein